MVDWSNVGGNALVIFIVGGIGFLLYSKVRNEKLGDTIKNIIDWIKKGNQNG